MKKFFLLVCLTASTAIFAQQKDYGIQAVNFTRVKLTDQFWLPRLKTNHAVTIPASFERCQNTGRVKNFEMAAARSGSFCTKFPFDDTDIYKTIEGASFSLALFPDKKLEAYMDTLIRKVGAAQEPDGYLYTSRTIDPAHPHAWSGKERWEKERDMSHELYNSGHLYEAAAAHYYATGKKSLLNIALKNADLVCSVFGPGKRHVAPGHEIVEMGLVKLYRITGKKEYLETAKDFIEARGHYDGYDTKNKDPFRNGSYWQDNKPVTGQDEAVGHAVRAGYLYSGVADVAALTGDREMVQAIDRIWENMVSKKFYVNGGVGAVPGGERFGDNYELPNATAYNETCAAIANVFWNHRMFLLHGDARYIDVLERSLYNGLLSGLGLDGKSFFYSNAMEVKNSYTHPALERSRAGWFECSCCPTNLVRLLPSVPGYMYAQEGDNVYVNLFASSTTEIIVHNKPVSIVQQNNYPWDGALTFVVSPQSADPFNLLLRIPGWAQDQVVPSDLYQFAGAASGKVAIRINGQPVDYTIQKGYAVLNRKWKNGDVVKVDLPMEVRTVTANEKLAADAGKVAVERGPLVYCAEAIDNGGRAANILLPASARYNQEVKPEMLNGVVVIRTVAPVVQVSSDKTSVATSARPVTLIPYYAWANRGEGEMTVWFPQQVQDIDIITRSNNTSTSQK
ncbi:glycoside hydrolase family 127 protein [Flavisolibacter nicotianae]|uniref:glycoside hydrolase family 127 protein n=1 Tax=Flavisolibacter nicotianae TaxID=2364882 RepID=UPI000EAFD691|nr:beta-L-arabinofuranosidase domain-containing protein [Flavisolibacter nicotianae]